MTQLNSKFDVISHDPHPAALASQMVMLDVKNAPAPQPSGTPTPGNIYPGTIAPCLFFVALDGDVDYDGAFVHTLTAMAGGGELQVENYVSDTYAPGDMLTCGDAGSSSEGQWRKATGGEQIYGVVGPLGQDTVENTLDVIVPQGIAPAA
jgi:hypothetical protein